MYYKASINYSIELYVVSIVAYQDQDYQAGSMDMDKKKKGLSAHAHNNYCARGQSSKELYFAALF